MKYVILAETVTEGVTRIHHMIFPEFMTHQVVALGYAAAFKHEEKKLLSVVSGGMCQLDNEGFWECEHGSTSMGLPRNSNKDEQDAAARAIKGKR